MCGTRYADRRQFIGAYTLSGVTLKLRFSLSRF